MSVHTEEYLANDIADAEDHTYVDDDAIDSPAFLRQVFEAGLLIPTGVDGLYGRSATFEDVVDRISDLIGAWGADKPVEVLRFPPAMSRQVIEESGYWGNFPTQLGTVFSFNGDDRSHQRLLKCLDKGDDWTEDVQPTRIVMTPVACYPVYPVMAARGRMPKEGRLVDIFSYCCRHEPSREAERMIMFRQREFVRMGTPAQVQAFRDDWMEHAKRMMRGLALPGTIASANDPFFGRGGKILADSQRQQQLKFEMLVPGVNPNKPTAVGSFNYHRDRFSGLWKILLDDGEIAHTGCCGFGLERIALSMFRLHGFNPAKWPEIARETLWGDDMFSEFANDQQADQAGAGGGPAQHADATSTSGFLDALLAAGLLIPTGVDGLYGRSARFEDVIARVDARVGQWADGQQVEVLRFPPAMSRQVLEESGYWANCPDQIGTVFSFCGDERSHQRLLKCLDNQDDWTEDVKPTRLSMTPAACYPVYPVMAARGPMQPDGRTIDLLSYCFRHEPSLDPARMQTFRQREFVRMGTPEQVLAFRSQLVEFASALMRTLRLPASVEVANDPFFGRAGKIMIDIQRRQELKYELIVPRISTEKPTACASFNYHQDRFGALWKIATATGEIAHTGCVGFGLERIALGLFRHHGLDVDAWPRDVLDVLWGDTARVAA